MTVFSFTVDVTQLDRRVARAGVSIPATLDRFVQRAANEFARAEKKTAPKALSTLTNSIAAHKNGIADYSVGPGVRYAAAVNNGGRPHWAPLAPLLDWLRVTKRVTDPLELRARARGLQRFIAAHGTRPNPFVQRARSTMDDRVVDLMRQGARTAMAQSFETS